MNNEIGRKAQNHVLSGRQWPIGGSTTLSTTKHKFHVFQLYGFGAVNRFVIRMKVTSSAKVYCPLNVCGVSNALGLLFILHELSYVFFKF